jgi:two-component system sensor histidine kinase/response regulator
MRRVLNKRSTFESLLRKFIAGQADVVPRTQALLSTGHLADAIRAMHTLKGTASTIGAQVLADLADAAETALNTEGANGTVQPLLARIALAMAELVQALEAVFTAQTAPQAAPAAPQDVDWPQARSVIARLQTLLGEDDAEAMDVFASHSALLSAALGSSYREIDTALNNYMLGDALDALRAAKSRIHALKD